MATALKLEVVPAPADKPMKIPRGYRLAVPHEIYALRWGQQVDVLDTHNSSVNIGVVVSDRLTDLAPAPVEVRLRSGAIIGCWGIPIPTVDQFRVLERVIDVEAITARRTA